jgi:hypothetical protein
MDVSVLPPARGARRDFIVIHERLVYQEGRFNMELVIGGSPWGLRVLAGYFDDAATQTKDDPTSHEHVDADEKLLALPAVYLNLREPLSDVEGSLEEVAPPDPRDLPSDFGSLLDTALWPYERLTYNDLYGRLPLKTR